MVALTALVAMLAPSPIASYSALLGSLPDDQGWTYVDSLPSDPQPDLQTISTPFSGDWNAGSGAIRRLNFRQASSVSNLRYYYVENIPFQISNGLVIRARIRFPSTGIPVSSPNVPGKTGGEQYPGFAIAARDTEGRYQVLSFHDDRWVRAIHDINNYDYIQYGLPKGNPTNNSPFLQLTTERTQYHEYVLVVPPSENLTQLYIDGHLVSEVSTNGSIISGGPYAPRVWFGDGSSAGGVAGTVIVESISVAAGPYVPPPSLN